MEDKTLITMGMTQSEFGSALLTEAKNRKQKEKLEQSVNEAQMVLSSLDECERQIKYFKAWKETRLGQLEALEKGKFSFGPAGEIVYDDRSLNRR